MTVIFFYFHGLYLAILKLIENRDFTGNFTQFYEEPLLYSHQNIWLLKVGKINQGGSFLCLLIFSIHEKLSTAYKSEVCSMAHSSAALRSPKRGMRVLRSRKHSIDLVNTADAQCLKRFLKIARVSALGAIVKYFNRGDN